MKNSDSSLIVAGISIFVGTILLIIGFILQHENLIMLFFGGFIAFIIMSFIKVGRKNEDCLNYDQGYIAGFSHNIETIKKLEEELKQRDEVIGEINQYILDCGVAKEMAKNCGIYVVDGIEIYKILQKYKGDNKMNKMYEYLLEHNYVSD